MPVPIWEALEAHEAAAVSKARQMRGSAIPQYMLSAALAGAFIGVAVVLMLMVGTAFIADSSPSTKLVQGSVFGIALTLVVFAGAELFTGNVMVMIQGVMKRVVTPAELVFVWVASLIGNLIGSLAFSALVAATGIVNAAPKGKLNPVGVALAGIVQGKVNLTGDQLFFRSLLCNFLVCLALWMAMRTKSDAAKLICLWWALLAFIASGFEHSIANMTVFGLALFVHTVNPQTHVHLGTVHNLISNLAVTVPGNIVGGGLLVGFAYGWIGQTERRQAAADAPEPQTIDLTRPEGRVVDSNGHGDEELVAATVAASTEPPARARPIRAASARTTTPPPRRRPTA
jgi:nitrite transporter NirC